LKVAVLAGGVGAARFLAGLVRAVEPADVTAIVNVGDDLELFVRVTPRWRETPRMLAELGHEATVVGIARLYAPLCGTLVIDGADEDRAADVEAEGIRCVVTDTIMRDPDVAATLARAVLDASA